MSRTKRFLIIGMILASLLLGACTGQTTPAPTAAPAQPEVTAAGETAAATSAPAVNTNLSPGDETGFPPAVNENTNQSVITDTMPETGQQQATAPAGAAASTPAAGASTPAVAEGAPASQPAGYGTITQRVIDRGTLVCGSRTDLAGFGFLDDSGRNAGFDVDLCRAVAAAVLGDPEQVEFALIGTPERGPALQTGEVDIMARNMTWTSTRETQWGTFTWITFFDGQGFMARTDLGADAIEDLNGATICVTSGTTTELNLADAFRQRSLDFTPVVFEDTASVYGAYQEGRCDAVTSDLSQLAALRSGFSDPTQHQIMDITISKEPLTPAVPAGDEQWADIVKVVIWGLINAEELGVTQDNVAEMASSENVEVRRLLGAEGTWGQADLGLPADVMVRVITAVGNYGEIYDRYMGENGQSFTLDRGLNRLWTEGGLVYAPPLR